jgi:hypothetical protein
MGDAILALRRIPRELDRLEIENRRTFAPAQNLL